MLTLGYIGIGLNEGAKLVLGGSRIGNRGYFVQPTVLSGVDGGTRVAQKEIFGPVVSVMRFGDEAEALRLANGTVYSLASVFWTSNVDRAHRAANQISAGTVWVNTYRSTDARLPWGGMGSESGIGRDLGRSALEAYTETKTIWLQLGGGSAYKAAALRWARRISGSVGCLRRLAALGDLTGPPNAAQEHRFYLTQRSRTPLATQVLGPSTH